MYMPTFKKGDKIRVKTLEEARSTLTPEELDGYMGYAASYANTVRVISKMSKDPDFPVYITVRKQNRTFAPYEVVYANHVDIGVIYGDF